MVSNLTTSSRPPPSSSRRTRGSSQMQVWLSHSETREWVDLQYRADAVKGFRQRALERGRKYFEVFGADGKLLLAGEV